METTVKALTIQINKLSRMADKHWNVYKNARTSPRVQTEAFYRYEDVNRVIKHLETALFYAKQYTEK